MYQFLKREWDDKISAFSTKCCCVDLTQEFLSSQEIDPDNRHLLQ